MMTDVPDPTGGWAKATEEGAKASQEAIQAGRELGRFFSGPAGELAGMWWDHLKVVRFERQVRLWERVRHFCDERGLLTPTRKIPLNIGVPLRQNATLEEDDDLQDVWARLLVNSADASSGIELRRAFVSVLAEMTSLDVRNLAQIEIADKLNEESSVIGVWTLELPERAIPVVYAEPQRTGGPSPDVEVSLSNLVRLGCIISSNRAPVPQPHHLVILTPFGRAFIDACTK
jgi:hypothetical protein